MAAKGAGYWKRRACLCGRLAGKGPSVAVWARCQKKKKKSHNKLIGHSLIVRFSPPLSLFQQVNTQRKAIVQLILEKRELLVGQRVKRDGTAHQKSSSSRRLPFFSRHRLEDQAKSSYISSYL